VKTHVQTFFICCSSRETTDVELLNKAAETVSRYFSQARDFRPTSVVIATWDDVGYFEAKSDKVSR
jgi:hypothetical protein